MTIEETIRDAFDYLYRYETYAILRALGLLVIYIGIGYFLTSFAVMALLREYLEALFIGLGLPCTEIAHGCETQAWKTVLNIQLLLFIVHTITLVIIMFPIVRSLRRTTTKDQTIATQPVIVFIAIIFILYITTFHHRANHMANNASIHGDIEV